MDALNEGNLIDKFFQGNEDTFLSEVSFLEWTEKTLFCRKDLKTGEVERRIVGADTNPFGWRKEAEG
ncbi:MAG: hypothetical protein AAF734_01885 [Bacteroidota bacterium]